MPLTKEEIAYIAHLARLDITENDLEVYQQDLSNILGLVDEMNQENTDNIKPMAHPFKIYQRLREDEVTAKVKCNELQSLSSHCQDSLYLVPKVIE